MLRGPPVAPFHECTNGRRRSVEYRHAVTFADIPEAILLRPIGSALVHDDGCAIGERAVHNVRVAGDPADVRGAPKDVLVLQIEDDTRGRRTADEISAGGVNYSLRLSGRARSIEDV